MTPVVAANHSSKKVTNHNKHARTHTKNVKAALQAPFVNVPSVSGDISPNIIEVENGIANDATNKGTNIYPRNMGTGAQSDTGFPDDPLASFLGFKAAGLSNNPVLNPEYNSAASVRLVEANISLSLTGAANIDGKATANGDRVLVTHQSSAIQNGIYIVAAGAWSRAADTLAYGTMVKPTDGNKFIGSLWLLNTSGAIVVNTTPLSFVRINRDWIKDTLVNNDAASVNSGIATGILQGVSGTAYVDSVKHGHWQGARVVDTIANAEQDIFVQGGKEDDVKTWNVQPGSVGSSKYDITQAYIASTATPTTDTVNFPPVGLKKQLFFAMERRGNNGTTAFDFEFNQQPPATTYPDGSPIPAALQGYIPNRTDGDVLFTFEMNGSGSSGSATPHIYVYHTSDHSFLNHELTGTSAIPIARRPFSNINQTTTPSSPWGYVDSKGNWTIDQIPNFSVAEAAVPFGIDFLQGVNGCSGHAYVQVRTRSSVTNTSDLKDTTKIFEFLFTPLHADMQMASNCDQSFNYDAQGSSDGGNNNLTYDWTFDAPAGVTLGSSDPEFGVDNSDPTIYHASFTSDTVRNVQVTLPDGVDYADIVVHVKVTGSAGCTDQTVDHTVRVWRVLGATATLTAPCSSTHEIDYSSTVTGGKSPYSYSWTFYKKGTPDVQVGTSTSASGSFNASSAGDYYGTLTVKDTADTSNDANVTAKGQCTANTSSNTVSTYDTIVPNATLSGTCEGYDLTYGSNPTGGDGNYTYDWKFYLKGTPDTLVGTASDKSGTFTASADGDYYATLKVTSAGCSTQVSTGTVTVAAPMNPQATKFSSDGSALTVTLKVTYHSPATVQWQKYVNNAWVDISGATGDTYTYSAFETDDTSPAAISYTAGGHSYVGKVYTVKFRAKTHRTLNGGCDATSNEVTVTKTIGVDP